MRMALEKYIPDGETLLAGIHAIAKETNIIGIFDKFICTEYSLRPDENGGIIALRKKKGSAYDVYLGITQSFLVIAECEKCCYLYQFKEDPEVGRADVQELTSELFLNDIGTCYNLTDIQKCEIKKGGDGFCEVQYCDEERNLF